MVVRFVDSTMFQFQSTSYYYSRQASLDSMEVAQEKKG